MGFGPARKWFSLGGIRDLGLVVLGSVVMAAGYVFFIVPYKIVPGGVYGLAIVAHHLLGLPTGTVGLVLNVPLILWGVRELGPKFGFRTLAGIVLTSAFIDGMTLFWGTRPLIPGDIMISSVFGGILIGAGLGFIFLAKATTGGTDIVAQILWKHTKLPVGQLLMAIDALVVTVGVLAFREIQLALYALVTIYVTGRVVDVVVTGMNYRKGAFVISDRPEAIRPRILEGLNRGGTYFFGEGMYEGKKKKIIFTAVNRRELAALLEYVKQEDPSAFMVVFDIHDVLGEGFKPFSEA